MKSSDPILIPDFATFVAAINIPINYGADKAASLGSPQLASTLLESVGNAFTVYYYLRHRQAASSGLPAAQSEIYPPISAADRENRRTIRLNGGYNDAPTRFTAVTCSVLRWQRLRYPLGVLMILRYTIRKLLMLSLRYFPVGDTEGYK